MSKETTIRRMKKMIKPYAKLIIILSIIAIIIDTGEIIKPYLLKIVIDDYLSLGIYQKGAITVTMIGIIYLCIVILGNISELVVKILTSRMGENVVYELRNKIYKYIEYSNISFHDKTPSGKLFVRLTSDVEDISALFKEVITTFIKDIVLIIVLIVMMIYICYKLSLVSLIIIPLIIIVSYVMTKMLNKIYAYSKTIRTRLNTFFAESIYGIKLIKIFNRQYEKQKECKELNEEFISAIKPARILESMLPAIMLIIENLGIAIVIIVLVNKILGISLEIGIVYMFITYIKQIFEPINRIIENIELVQEAITSIDKIYELLEHEEYIENMKDGKILNKISGKIEFKHVWFAYEKENWILKDVNFVINPGESIALVGKTGSGKTTITNLINRFYDIQKGEILIDGINIKDINIKSLRKSIGTILQDPFIYARTMKDNIRLYSNIEDENIEKAVDLSSARELINSLPNGLNEIAKERGNSFSSGEKQLIAFTRIFAHNPSIFILDEATASIDTGTEKIIQKSIDEISKNKTSIFIAHRLSTVVNVNKIIVLDKGSIIEQGNHQELMKKGGYYSNLYEAYYKTLTKNEHIGNII